MHQQSSCGGGRCHSHQPHCSKQAAPAVGIVTHLQPLPAADTCCSHRRDKTADEEDERTVRGFRYSWLLTGMDCPSCAGKIETAVSQLARVSRAKVIFASEKLVVDADSDVRAEVEQAVMRAGFQLRPQGAAAPARPQTGQEYRSLILLAVLMAASWLMSHFWPAAGSLAFSVTTLYGVWPIARSALRQIRGGTLFSIELLMSIAAVGALFIGATSEAAMVLLLFMLGEKLESFAASRARKGVTALMALKPDEAVRVRDGQRSQVQASELRPGDIIEVSAGGRLPADARLVSDFASFDESAMTGESLPAERQQGEVVAAGCLSVDRLVQLEVVSLPGASAIDRILQLIEEAEERKAPVERFLDRFSRIYTPAVMLVALLVALIPPLLLAAPWQPWIYKALTLLLIGCPCALVISIPAAVTSGLAAAARRGALIKGGAALESLGKVRTITFDKTGTLTAGKPQITQLIPLDGQQEDQLLAEAAAAEQGSSHPLAQGIVTAASDRQLLLPPASAQRVLPGSGIEAEVSGRLLTVRTPGKIQHLLSASQQATVEQLENAGNTVVVMHSAQQLLGIIALRDTLRPEARAAIADLQALNIHSVMLTGDNPRAAAAIAAELGIDYRASLMPQDKVSAVNALNQQQPVAMVGDGINDAPAMKAATIGIAMGSGSDVALETADAALTHNRLSGLVSMIRLSRATQANIYQNVSVALGLKAIFLVTSLLGITGLWLAVLADSGATALVTANALRLLRRQ